MDSFQTYTSTIDTRLFSYMVNTDRLNRSQTVSFHLLKLKTTKATVIEKRRAPFWFGPVCSVRCPRLHASCVPITICHHVILVNRSDLVTAVMVVGTPYAQIKRLALLATSRTSHHPSFLSTAQRKLTSDEANQLIGFCHPSSEDLIADHVLNLWETSEWLDEME